MSFGNKLIDDVAAFMRSRIMLTAADLDLFTELDRKPRSAPDLAADLGLDVRAATRVLDCLVVCTLLEKTADRYRLTGRARPLSSLHPESILPMIQHMSTMWGNWSQLTKTVRTGKNPDRVPVIGTQNKDVMRAFIGAMHVVGKDLSREIAALLDLSTYSMLLDIGGGPGTYTLAFLEKNPHMQAIIFDFPDVLALARERIGSSPLAGRICYAQGDFYKDELPTGCDCALLSAIIHQNSPQENIALFRKIHAVLNPGGCLIIRDHIMDESRTSPPSGAFFAINMLVATPAGDTYTFNEVKDMLEKAGFTYAQLLETGERMDCIVQARKTGA
jgi:ubiquinone/menaquinone biosynthesis C-methylase UbiE